MSTPYLSRIIAGDRPTLDEWNDHLMAFHSVYRDATDQWLSLLRTGDGKTSYDVLTDLLKASVPKARNFLDIGCGDGALLARIANAFPEGLLTGVDLSQEQLVRSAAKLPRATFLRGDASRMDLGCGQQDAVVAHLSFMLIPRTVSVLRRAYAALRPGGLLAFVAEDPLAGDTIVSLMASSVARVRERLPHFAPSVPGRAPIERDEVLEELLNDVGFKNVSIDRFDVHARLSIEQLWGFVEQTYTLGLLDHSIRLDLRRVVTAAMTQGPVETRLSLRLVSAYSQ
jgi:trans-aconitate methyltransferase